MSPVTTTMAKALNMALRSCLEEDPKVVLIGEDIGKLGGVFRITDGLQKDFGEHRVIDSPLAESGIVGTAVGLALRGYRPVTEIQFDGFVFPAFDQIVSQVAKMSYRTRGAYSLPLVIRIPYGGGIGAVEHHGEAPESFFCHIAGLRVMTCSTVGDAYEMMKVAIRSPDPVVFFEPKKRYWDKGDLDLEAAPPNYFGAIVRRVGTDATIASYGPSMKVALAAADAALHDGQSLEVIDLRSLSPLDIGPVVDSVRKTGRLVVVSEAPKSSSITSEVAARVTEEAFYSLSAPVQRVAGFDTPYPPSRVEEDYLPSVDKILAAVDTAMSY